MPQARSLTQRLRRLAPEAMAFAAIGAFNTLLYMAITYVALGMGAVKASVLATVITTTLAYFANRYWTYRHHTRSALRREYSLFFGFNLVGMVIQSGSITVGKYGFGLSETDHKLEIMGVTLIGVGIATVFRFWAYRTFVFLKPKKPEPAAAQPAVAQPVTAHDPLVDLDPLAGFAELSAHHETGADPHAAVDGTRRPTPTSDLDRELAAELEAARRHANR